MTLRETLRRLAALPPSGIPLVSAHLNLTPQGPGVLTYPVFLKKHLSEELRRVPERSPEHESLERDAERIQRYLDYELPEGTRAVSLFARLTKDTEFFEALPIPTDFPEHLMVVSRTPFVIPLVRLSHRFVPALAAVVDTNTSRLFVISMGQIQARREVHDPKIKKPQMGGWAQPRYQRHAEHAYLHHAKETADALDRLLRESGASFVLLGGDEVILPELKRHLSKQVAERLLGVHHWDIRIPEHELVQRVIAQVEQAELERKRQRVLRVLEAAQANGQAVLGPGPTVAALCEGKVEELVLADYPRPSATARVCVACNELLLNGSFAACPRCGAAWLVESSLREEMVTRALAQGGEVEVVEPMPSLEQAGGVAAALRFK